MLGAGAAYCCGKQTLEAPGPLQPDKTVVIPARAGMSDIADLLQREGVIEQPLTFIGAVFALKARRSSRPANTSSRSRRRCAT